MGNFRVKTKALAHSQAAAVLVIAAMALAAGLSGCSAYSAAGDQNTAASSGSAVTPGWEPVPGRESSSAAGLGAGSGTGSGEGSPGSLSAAADERESGTGSSTDVAHEPDAGGTQETDMEAGTSFAAQVSGTSTEEADSAASTSGISSLQASSSQAEDADQTAATTNDADPAADETSGHSSSPNSSETVPSVQGHAGESSDAALASLMQTFMQNYNLDASNFAVAYRNLSTGTTYYYNELKQWDACSTYKLPLNLLYYDMQAAGEITGDTIIPGTGTTLAECHHQSLEFSNNPLSEAMMDNLGSYDKVKQRMRKYFTLTDAETDESYYHHNYFCARQMMDCAQYLYDHQSEYQEALGYLEAAQPGQYFRRYLPDVTIAQKYGLRDGYNHNAGIIFADTPFVLSVYSYQAGGDEMIARCAQALYEYTEQ